ncbi:MAG TPA: DNA mismatch repair endonuclease MutL [Virgibacillus sp.]|nr:DNA mismatch repair endonuclease MutL [Virgibacillus sp.]HLR66214.1 DNA mismatch repair endonuclease MutL [Virgibacillus sp.]
MNIFQLPDSLANKIAAGEVVERPASVVKELVENSIDADSTWIKIEIVEAGLQQIKVIDNGEGMSEEDCETAFLRHATSKIKNDADLFHVRTLGFRGEALASISSVSKLTIKTSQGDAAGTLLKLEGGKVKEKQKSDARKGTEISVEDLFYNTPARLKYMKTIHTELGHITDLINRLALSHPQIRFEVIHNDKTLFKTAGTGDLLHVVAQVYGMEAAKKMLPIESESLDFSIKGYIAKPEVTRASKSYISTIINGRYIKSYVLNQAIIRAYHTLLPIGRFPIVVIAIQMDPILVDVNVHPTKLEVRFSKEKELFSIIEETIKSKFRETTLIPEITKQEKPKNESFQHTFQFDHSPTRKDNWKHEERMNTGSVLQNENINEKQPEIYVEPSIDKPDETFIEQPTETFDEPRSIPQQEINQPINQSVKVRDRIPPMYPIGQLQGTYLLAQNENGLYMIDQHAAQERIKYEYYKEKLGNAMKESQELLIPLTFDFSKQESIFIDRYKKDLEEVGLFFEEFGNQTYIIRSHPTWFPSGFEEDIIREMVEQIMQNEKINIELIRDDAAALMACKRSIKANHHLNKDDMFRLLEDLRQTTDPFTCPHGRPIIVHFSSYELEKMFKRVM